jgi:flagellin-like protein
MNEFKGVNMRGISPLIASILLIALTVSIAAILANWATSMTQQTLSSVSRCPGARLEYTTTEYPKWNSADGTIVAVLSSIGATMGQFKFEVLLTNDTVLTLPDKTGLVLSSGATGTAISDAVGVTKDKIKSVRVSGNCTGVATTWESLR